VELWARNMEQVIMDEQRTMKELPFSITLTFSSRLPLQFTYEQAAHLVTAKQEASPHYPKNKLFQIDGEAWLLDDPLKSRSFRKKEKKKESFWRAFKGYKE
jgi:hypothetical protein